MTCKLQQLDGSVLLLQTLGKKKNNTEVFFRICVSGEHLQKTCWAATLKLHQRVSNQSFYVLLRSDME